MRVLTKDEVTGNMQLYSRKLKNTVFIYPTDTIYGIGCNAMDPDKVNTIRRLKQRNEQPFSVIPPSKEWILKNCEIPDDAKGWLEKLPGPYTFILKVKEGSVAREVAPGMLTLGVRIPDNWFSEFVSKIGFPIVTTSVNKTGEDFMKDLESLDPDIKKGVDYLIFEGEKSGRPSTIVDFTQEKVKIRER